MILRILMLALLGWIAGQAINYLSDVLPRRRRLAAPFCLACQAPLASPSALARYALWPGRCPACGKPRGQRALWVNLAAVAATLWLGMRLQGPLDFAMSWALLVYFGVVTVIDLEHRLILHPVSLAGAAISLGIGAYLHGWKATLLGGLAGFGGMLGIYILGIILVQVLARWRNASVEGGEALGFGDVALSGVIGLLLGYPVILAGLFLTIVVAGIASLVFMIAMALLHRYRPGMAIPYGPFLVFSAVFLLFIL